MWIGVSGGRAGAGAYDGGRWGHRAAMDVDVASTAGAGDALFAGVIAGLAAGLDLVGEGGEGVVSGALDLGVLLAGFSVTSVHTIHPGASVGALVEFAGGKGVEFSDAVMRKIV